MNTNRSLDWVAKGWMLLVGLSLAPGLLQAKDPVYEIWPINTNVNFVSDIQAQFQQLSERPDALGFDIGWSTNPSLCKHYENIVRVQGPDDTPYFILTRSGVGLPRVPPCLVQGDVFDEPGTLIIVRMATREKHGERMRSNRLERGDVIHATPPVRTCDVFPDCFDVVVTEVVLDGTNEWPVYRHPESMQTIGDVLVLGFDSPPDSNPQKMQVLFVDVSNPEYPRLFNRFLPEDPQINGGIIAITPLEDGRYLLMITGASRAGVFNEKMWFFESKPTPPLSETGTWDCSAQPSDGGTDLRSNCLSWELVSTWAADARCMTDDGPMERPFDVVYSPNFGWQYVPAICNRIITQDEVDLGMEWPMDAGREHQSFQFLRESDMGGALYLAGTRGGLDLPLGVRLGDDHMDLFRVVRVDGNGPYRLEHVLTRRMNTNFNSQSTFPLHGETNFAASAGFYVSPLGDLLLYATEHANGGPFDTVRVGEWRSRDMHHSPASQAPRVKLFGPFEVDEGESLFLQGVGMEPIHRAWLQLFEETGFAGRYVVMDYSDRDKSDFDNFRGLEGILSGFTDKAKSLRWFSPHSSCAIEIFEHHTFGGDSAMLGGFGGVVQVANLAASSVAPHLHEEISSARFSPGCDQYYNALPDLYWDVNFDGSFARPGNTIVFNAGELDGPSQVEMRVKAVHPADLKEGETLARITVRNVAPTITGSSITNSLGQELGVDVPFLLEQVRLTLWAQFTDPGKLDTQIASIKWGDGQADASSDFEYFSDALGGVVGQLSHSHVYSTAGDYLLTLSVIDDDEGETSASELIPVLSVAQALDYVIEQLQWHMRHANNKSRKPLSDALKALEGSKPPLSQNGARDKLNNPDVQAALTKLRQAIDYLRTAQAAGADVGMLIMLLEQVIASLLA